MIRYSKVPNQLSCDCHNNKGSDLFQIVPNPSNSYVNIVLKSDLLTAKTRRKVVVMNMTGQIKMEKKMLDTTVQLDIRNLSVGIYLVAIQENDAMKHIGKLVITQ